MHTLHVQLACPALEYGSARAVGGWVGGCEQINPGIAPAALYLLTPVINPASRAPLWPLSSGRLVNLDSTCAPPGPPGESGRDARRRALSGLISPSLSRVSCGHRDA